MPKISHQTKYFLPYYSHIYPNICVFMCVFLRFITGFIICPQYDHIFEFRRICLQICLPLPDLPIFVHNLIYMFLMMEPTAKTDQTWADNLCIPPTKEMQIRSPFVAQSNHLNHSVSTCMNKSVNFVVIILKVITLLKPENREFGKPKTDRQLHVLPNYRMSGKTIFPFHFKTVCCIFYVGHSNEDTFLDHHLWSIFHIIRYIIKRVHKGP